MEALVELLHYVFELFKDLIHFKEPNYNNNKGYPYLRFNTIISPQFTELYHSWYTDNVKSLPSNIYQLIDKVALAF